MLWDNLGCWLALAAIYGTYGNLENMVSAREHGVIRLSGEERIVLGDLDNPASDISLRGASLTAAVRKGPCKRSKDHDVNPNECQRTRLETASASLCTDWVSLERRDWRLCSERVGA